MFGCLERRWGVPLVDGGTVRLPQIVGLGRAPDLMLTGRQIDAHEALAIGLVNRVVKKGTARFPQTCLRADLRSTYDALSLPSGDAIRNELRIGLASLADYFAPVRMRTAACSSERSSATAARWRT